MPSIDADGAVDLMIGFKEGIDAFTEQHPPVWTGRQGGALFSEYRPSGPGFLMCSRTGVDLI